MLEEKIEKDFDAVLQIAILAKNHPQEKKSAISFYQTFLTVCAQDIDTTTEEQLELLHHSVEILQHSIEEKTDNPQEVVTFANAAISIQNICKLLKLGNTTEKTIVKSLSEKRLSQDIASTLIKPSSMKNVGPSSHFSLE